MTTTIEWFADLAEFIGIMAGYLFASLFYGTLACLGLGGLASLVYACVELARLAS